MSTHLSERKISYTPLGESKPIELSLGVVKRFIAAKTKNGSEPTDEDTVKFMMLCQSRGLNPWVGDAFLVGYDGKDGPQFTLITAYQAVAKRAELSHQFDGIEGGVIVKTKDGIIERPGELCLDGETLIGAWARCHRKDRRVPHYIAVNRRMYDKGRSLWQADPAAMLVKCAKAKAMREAFPSELGGLVVEGEFEATVAAKEPPKPRIASAFASEATPDPLAGPPLVACATCGREVPEDVIDMGDCPDCFSAKERA
jgi:phage recombination protein Bet